MSTGSFEGLATRLRAGDQAAASLVFDRFASRLIGLASRRLDRLLRVKAEPADVVQSVFGSFFTRQRHGEFNLDGWENLWRVLVAITLRKCCNRAQHFRAARRDVRREVSWSAGATGAIEQPQVPAREPTPEEAAELADTLEQVLRPFGEREQAIVRLSLQGGRPAEVAAQAGCSERKVYRVLERLREQLELLRAGAGTEAA